MATIRLKGPGLNDWMAREIVKNNGPEKARELTTGEMREAVERVLAELDQAPQGEKP